MVKRSSTTLDDTFAALSDPTRRQMLSVLARGDITVTELARPFAMSLPAASKHVRVLERAGLVRRRRLGREHHLSLHAAPLREAAAWVQEYARFWGEAFDRLDELFATQNPPPEPE